MSKIKGIMIRVPEELHRAVRIKTAEQGRTIAEIVRALLEKWISGEVKVLDDDA